MILLLDFLVFFSAAWLTYHLFLIRCRWEPDTLPLRAILPSLFKGPSSSSYRRHLQKKLTTARRKLSSDHFVSLQLLSGGGGMITGTILALLLRTGWPSVPFLILSLTVFFLIGFFFPLIKLINDVQERQKNMVKDLSYYLDLMTLGVEAGLDYLNVLTQVMANSRQGPLKEELETWVGQVQMGKSRSEAWREFADRIDLPEIRSLVLALIQTDQAGSPLSGALRGLSQEIKIQRFQLAEKRAYQMPVKMLVPLLGCIFPAVFILIFEPLILRFLHLF